MKKSCSLFLLLSGLFLTAQASPLPASLKAEPQQRDAPTYIWEDRHKAILQRNKIVRPNYVMIGDSITHRWGGEPCDNMSGKSPESWNALFGNHQVTNMGFGFDYIDNVYYRILHKELDGLSPRVIILLLGTNNIGHRKDSASMCADNMKALVGLIRKKCPNSKILILGILPRLDFESSIPVIKETNKLYEKLANHKSVFFANPGIALLEENSDKPKRKYMIDGVHPSSAGYKILGEKLQKILSKIDSEYSTQR